MSIIIIQNRLIPIPSILGERKRIEKRPSNVDSLIPISWPRNVHCIQHRQGNCHDCDLFYALCTIYVHFCMYPSLALAAIYRILLLLVTEVLCLRSSLREVSDYIPWGAQKTIKPFWYDHFGEKIAIDKTSPNSPLNKVLNNC